ncbi:hypothetical protein KPL70_008824 [Citrus sinensis]|nr:hypothetical protein KPL70_008824 [Citrus sinensis]
MITAFSTQHKFQSKRDETLLLQTDLSRANTVIPKPIQWKDVHLPEEWILEGAAPPAIPKQLEPNTELQNVTQYSDGKVKLSFRRSTSSISFCSSSGKTSESKHVVSSEEFFIENFDKAIDCWELPKISKEKIYKTKKLDFLKSDYIIKTEERDITLSNPFETIQLFSEHSLKKLKEKNFNYVHIGLIQVGIKPLTKEGLDTSILAVLRDGRFISFDDSLLSSIESSLCKGPISFDCYPNITISLKDKNILKSMILQIKTHNYNMIEGSIPVALIFKISYKAMITAFSTQHKFQSKRDETLLLQTDLSRANTVIPKPIQWKDVHLPEEWILEGAAPPAIPKQLEPNTELQNVTQYSDGKVKLSFRRSTSSISFCSSSGKTSESKHVVSSEEFFIENFDKAIDCWELPKISKEKIYKTKKLDFLKSDYIIKTEERDITLSNPFETIQLFSEHSLKKLKEKNFNYVHIGLIQVGIKPLTKEGLDTSILAVLRDGRFISFDDSLLSSIESSLCKGPISFDCYPNITISLKDKNILKSMILQIKTHNYNMIEGSIPVALIFKISYKAMITAFSTQHKFQSKRDETLLLQTDLSRANTVIPKPIQWKDVHLPEEWILEGAAPPAIPKQLEPNTELQNVTQYSDGKVKLSFRRSTSSRFSDKASCSSIPSLERKFTKVPSVINLPFQSQPRFSTSDIPSTSIRSVDYTTSVPHPIYTSSQHIQSQEEKEPSPPTSPTFSAVTENVINVIEKEFELDKTLLHNDFYSDLNKEKRLWFFKHFLNQRKEIQQFYYKFVNLHKVHILFFDWFEIYSSDNNIAYPFKESNPITIRKKTTEWKLSDSNRTVDSEHPPLRSVTVDHGEPPIEIRASPYKIPKPNDTDSNLSSIIQQNNFCSTNLNTIGKQLTRIENQFQQSTISVSPSQKPIPSKSDSDKKLKEPIFKPFQVSKTSQKLAHESKSDFAKAIREQLDRIEAASSSSSKFYHSDPFQSISKFFPKGWFFKPWDLTKPQSYYQSILEITESVKFKHFFLDKAHPEPAYSEGKIERRED